MEIKDIKKAMNHCQRGIKPPEIGSTILVLSFFSARDKNEEKFSYDQIMSKIAWLIMEVARKQSFAVGRTYVYMAAIFALFFFER